MKRFLLLVAGLATALALASSRPSAAAVGHDCYFETYGSGQCGMTCVWYNDQGNIDANQTYLYSC